MSREENLYEPNCIRTFSGRYINVTDFKLDDIDIDDIAHSLSMQCRFGGHTKVFYSVAQHSVECAKLVPNEYKLQALLHDASEAYLIDIPSPIKAQLSNYKDIENELMIKIGDKYGFEYPISKQVKRSDILMLNTEWLSLVIDFNPDLLTAQSQGRAKESFLEMFRNLI